MERGRTRRAGVEAPSIAGRHGRAAVVEVALELVVADARAPRDGRFIDKVGAYDPMKPKDDPARIQLDAEKIQGWLAKGAQPTDRVLRFLDQAGLAKRPTRNNPQKAEPGEKAKERATKRAEKAAAPAETPAESPAATTAA